MVLIYTGNVMILGEQCLPGFKQQHGSMNLNPNGVTGFMITHIHILENFIPEAHLLPFNGNSAIFFDIETTGFTAGKNSIYLIGCCLIRKPTLAGYPVDGRKPNTRMSRRLF